MKKRKKGRWIELVDKSKRGNMLIVETYNDATNLCNAFRYRGRKASYSLKGENITVKVIK